MIPVATSNQSAYYCEWSDFVVVQFADSRDDLDALSAEQSLQAERDTGAISENLVIECSCADFNGTTLRLLRCHDPDTSILLETLAEHAWSWVRIFIKRRGDKCVRHITFRISDPLPLFEFIGEPITESPHVYDGVMFKEAELVETVTIQLDRLKVNCGDDC